MHKHRGCIRKLIKINIFFDEIAVKNTIIFMKRGKNIVLQFSDVISLWHDGVLSGMYVEVVEKVHIKISISKNFTLSKYQVLKFLVKI